MFPLSATLYSLHGYRIDCSRRENACAVLAPGKLPKKSAIDINDSHRAAGHSHEVLLRKTAEQQGVALERELLGCRGCDMDKGLRKRIKQPTHTRADKKLRRFFVDLSGSKVVEFRGRKLCTPIVRNDFDVIRVCTSCATSRTTRDRSSSSSRISRADGVPSTVVIVRSDEGGVDSAGGRLKARVDHEVSSRNSRRPTVSISMGYRARVRFG